MKKFNNIFKGDKVIWMVFFFLCIISIIEVFSASSALTYKKGNYMGPIIYHSVILLMGTVVMIIVLNIKCKYFKIVTPLLLLVAFLSLVIVLVAGQSTNGASRWISFLGIQFQPSEIAKGAMILAEAQILSAMQTDKGADRRAFKYILIVALFMIAPIAVENLSTAALLFAVVIMLMIIGRVPMTQIGKLMGICCLIVALFIGSIMLVGQDTSAAKKQNKMEEVAELTEPTEKKETGAIQKIFHRADTWKSRINKFISHEEIAPEDFDLDKDAQVGHANIAIATSNIIGKGPGNSVERDFLSQAFSDFIYAIIIEEMGIEGAAIVIFLYIVLLFRTGMIANRCENNFPAFLALGLALLLTTQAIFNMAVAVGLAPVTGQPLPLISKGGTSTIINCAYIGVILSISRSAKKRDEAGRAKQLETSKV